MRRTIVTDEQRAALQATRHDPGWRPRERDRVEMVLLSAAGWSSPRIAVHFGCSVKPVRTALDQYAASGLAGLRRRRPGPAPNAARRAQVTAALTALLAQERTWTAAQLAAALGEQGIQLSTRQTRKYLGGIAAWRRTVRTLAHKQDPVKVARAERHLGVLQKKGARVGSRSAISIAAASALASR
jgi:putative transposase